MNDWDFMERRIVTGLIVSTEYIDMIQGFWNVSLLESSELAMIARWCVNYYEKYKKAPDRNIENIYIDNLKTGVLNKTDAAYIEEILHSLSDEFGRGTQFNAAYLYDKTINYLKARELEEHNQEVQALVEIGKVEEAEKLASSYVSSILINAGIGIDLSDNENENISDRIERAFSETGQGVVTFPGALGSMWNEHLIRGGFFTLLAPEKRGKSFMLLEIALRAIRQKANVAFFEAGDMTESQVLKRICIYIAQKSDKEKYCRERFRPVGDCIFNQLDMCSEDGRNCDHGIFDGLTLDEFYAEQQKLITMENLAEKYDEFVDYEPCDSHGCLKRRGSPWLMKMKKVRPLTAAQAKKGVEKFFKRYKRRFKLVCYPAGTLSVAEIKKCLDEWERYDGFVPDVVVIDYADLLSAEGGGNEFRHRQDFIWKGLRALSQERHVLLATATQADAESYKRGRLSISNFSEDKRKLAHVTAQYGLNQDTIGREKKLGLMRINEIVVREGEFSADNEVCVLQDLAAGRPFLESFI